MQQNLPVMGLMVMAAMAACVAAVFVVLLQPEEIEMPVPVVYDHNEERDTWRLLGGPDELEWRGEPGARYGAGHATRASSQVPEAWTPVDWSTGSRLAFCADEPQLGWGFEIRAQGVQQRFVYAALASCQ